jgi:tetratricopeptide (TPR) repeat protein
MSSTAHRPPSCRAYIWNRDPARLLGALLATALVVLSCQSGPSSTDREAPPATTAMEPTGTTEATETKPPKLLEGLGDQTHPINTDVPLAQRYFDQGLILTFGFNHYAAIAAFEEAARLDPTCAMCHWGIALALGPNINAPMGPEAATRAYAEVQKALELVQDSYSAREKAYIEALAKRYSKEVPEDRSDLDLAYANAMRKVYEADPSDVDGATLFAESLMDLYPWAYWTAGGEPKEYTQEIVDTLEAVFVIAPNHVGANHYYIHAVEEYYPEKGEEAADRLGDLAPDAGHLVHMPSHIYWRIGRYEDATEINQRAAAADEEYFSWCAPGAFYRAAYYPHNIHFLWAAASTEGRSDLALMTARRLAAATAPDMAAMPMLQEFVAIPLLTQARFARWDSLLAEPEPAPGAVYVTGIWYYTRGLAQVRTGDADAARLSLAQLAETAQLEDAEALILAGGTASAAQLLAIAVAHLDGEIALAEGDPTTAIADLQRAAELHDGLAYMEPPPWYAPPRQVLGVVLLEQGRAEEAEAVYVEDLRQYPKNGWSLLGLAQSFDAQGEQAKADWARQGFEAAWARADVELESSRL